VQVQPPLLVAAPKCLAPIRAGLGDAELARTGREDVRLAARLLGWIEGEPPEVTDEGRRLLATTAAGEDEAAVFAVALLENPPLSTIASELLLGEWLELRNLAPELVRVVGLPTAQARWLVPGLLGWRNELRARGWTPRRVAEHLRSRTEWMDGLSTRGRDVLGKLGLITRERVLALDSGRLREIHRCREDTLAEIERFRASLRRPVAAARMVDAPAPRRAPAQVVEPFAEPKPSVRAAARRLVERRGCASIAALARECDKSDLAALRRALEAEADIRWLDPDIGWFWIPDLPRNRLVARIDKVLAVAEEIDVLELRAALARDRRMDGDAPPPPVLAALCEQLGDCELVDGAARVRDTRPRDADEILSSVEQRMVTILREHGPMVASGDATRLLVEAGINENTASVYLANSPLVRRVDGEGYTIVGDPPPPVVDGDTTIAELARIANMTVEQVVAIAMAGAERPTRRHGRANATSSRS